MKIEYSISFDDFRASQPPFTLRPGRNVGFKGVLLACLLMTLLGVYCLVDGFGIPVGAFLIGLGICSAAVGYFYERRSVAKSKEKYERTLALVFQQVHCRDHRTLAADDVGLTLSCRCGTVARPWSEFVRFSENNVCFLLGTKTEAHLVPKSAFSSEGEVTQFRSFFLEKLNAEQSITSRAIEFSYAARDFRDARILHIMHGGGWRRSLREFATVLTIIGGIYVVWDYGRTHGNAALIYGIMGGLAAALLLRAMKMRRKHFLGPQKIYFSEQGLLLQSSGASVRNGWNQFVGYLEGIRIVLLYYNPHLYRIIPRRALTGSAAEFLAMVSTKLPEYDYKSQGRR